MSIALESTGERRHGADAHWQASGPHGLARCSLWWSQVPHLPGERLGIIGHYGTDNAAAAGVLLHHVCGELRQQGCTLAAGPMDGSTWRQYRLITHRGAEPPFLLEPDHPDAWVAQFTGAGFAPLATYTSAVTEEIPAADPRIDRVTARLLSQGFTIRPLDMTRFERELELLFRLSLQSFAGNFLYTPIAEAEFVAQYSAVRRYVQPELVLIAEHRGEPAGFLFALPDWARAQRGQPVDTLIVKTLAVTPRYQGRGLGSVLLAAANRAAPALGLRRVIHALMHEENQSTRISARHATVFRRYALFARPL